MCLQPDGQRLAISAPEHVNRPAPFEGEQDRPAALAAPQGEVIDAQHPRGRHHALPARPQAAQEGVGAGRQPHAPRQPRPRRAGQPHGAGQWPHRSAERAAAPSRRSARRRCGVGSSRHRRRSGARGSRGGRHDQATAGLWGDASSGCGTASSACRTSGTRLTSRSAPPATGACHPARQRRRRSTSQTRRARQPCEPPAHHLAPCSARPEAAPCAAPTRTGSAHASCGRAHSTVSKSTVLRQCCLALGDESIEVKHLRPLLSCPRVWARHRKRSRQREGERDGGAVAIEVRGGVRPARTERTPALLSGTGTESVSLPPRRSRFRPPAPPGAIRPRRHRQR